MSSCWSMNRSLTVQFTPVLIFFCRFLDNLVNCPAEFDGLFAVQLYNEIKLSHVSTDFNIFYIDGMLIAMMGMLYFAIFSENACVTKSHASHLRPLVLWESWMSRHERGWWTNEAGKIIQGVIVMKHCQKSSKVRLFNWVKTIGNKRMWLKSNYWRQSSSI